MERDLDLDSFGEFFHEFVYSFPVFRHRSIDIVGHPDDDQFGLSLLYPFWQ